MSLSPEPRPRRRSRLSEEFSAERRLSVADRTKLERVQTDVSKLETTLKDHSDAVTKDIAELKAWVKWGMGFGAAAGVGMTVYHMLH